MTNKEKMLAGQVYDPNDEEIVSEQFEYLNAMKAYNALPYGDKREEEYLRKCFGAIGKQPVVTQPFFANWGGKHVFIGDYFYSNFNLTLVDDGKIEIGDNVSWNAGCYIDSKGGVKFGDFAMLTEYVKIFSHSHSEHDHMQREYNGVEIGPYAKVYTNASILPGVKLGTGAVVATGAIVTKSVDDFTLVSGIPARVQRMRKFDGKDLKEMNQYMMKNRLFQTYDGD